MTIIRDIHESIEWVEGKAVSIRFATGGNAGGVVPPLPPGGTNSGGEKDGEKKERDNETAGPYSYLKDGKAVGVGKDFTRRQKEKIYEENSKRNGGTIKSDVKDDPYQTLVAAKKSMKGVTPDQAEYQVDHIVARNNGGTNSYSNAQVTSRKYNRDKSDKY